MEGDPTPGRCPAWEWLRTVVALVLFLLFYVVFVASIPVLVVICLACDVHRLIGEASFYRRLRRVGRCMRSGDLEALTPSCGGTLIIEVIPGKHWNERAWWTPEDVLADAPCALPSESALCSGEAPEADGQEYRRFCTSVYQRYLGLEQGTAILVEDGSRDLADAAATKRLCLWHVFGEYKVGRLHSPAR